MILAAVACNWNNGTQPYRPSPVRDMFSQFWFRQRYGLFRACWTDRS